MYYAALLGDIWEQILSFSASKASTKLVRSLFLLGNQWCSEAPAAQIEGEGWWWLLAWALGAPTNHLTVQGKNGECLRLTGTMSNE